MIIVADGHTFRCERRPTNRPDGKFRLFGRRWLIDRQRWSAVKSAVIVESFSVDETEDEENA